MAKSTNIEGELAALEELRNAPLSAAVLAGLRRGLASRSNYVAARAAKLAGERELEQMREELEAAFTRFMANPLKTDPGCRAKLAAAEALIKLGGFRPDVFLQGIHHVQLEPVFGGREDTAAPLRALCAAGLVAAGYPGALNELADLLADNEPDARLGAVRAVLQTGDSAGIPLLRLKTRLGDSDPRIVYECFAALTAMDPEANLELVAHYLSHEHTETAEAAAFALGESRLPQAIPLLKSMWENSLDHDRRQAAFTALAMLRLESAIDYLIQLVAEESPAIASAAAQALALFRDDERIWPRVQQLAAERGDIALDPARGYNANQRKL